MPDFIRHSVAVPLSLDDAFALFTGRLETWWPREYTWSQDVLQDIGMEPHVDGLCYERGPHGFRSDWGRVVEWAPPRRVTFLWQISPLREPVPDPAHASTVEVTFEAAPPAGTTVVLTHRDFERHGDGADDYRAALASPQGWAYILDRFAAQARG